MRLGARHGTSPSGWRTWSSPQDESVRMADLELPAKGGRPILPAQPEEERGEERHEPAVGVLLVGRPFAAEMAAKDEPQNAECGCGDPAACVCLSVVAVAHLGGGGGDRLGVQNGGSLSASVRNKNSDPEFPSGSRAGMMLPWPT